MSNEIKESFKLLDKLEKVSSMNGKIELLKNGKDNRFLKEILFLSNNPYKTFGIKKIPVIDGTSDKKCTEKTFERFKNLLRKLERRDLTGNAAISAVKKFLESCNEREYKWYSRVIQKDLKIGASTKTINKVFIDLVPEFEVMAAESMYEKKKGKVIKNNGSERLAGKIVIDEPKLDGFRFYAFKHTIDKVVLTSRNGLELFGYELLEKEILENTEGFGYILDGEMGGMDFNSTMSTKGKKQKGKISVANLFDILPIANFMTKQPYDKPLSERKEWLQEVVSETQTLRIVEFSQPYEFDEETITKNYESYLEQGYEGSMVKDYNSIYEYRRSYSWLKNKPEETFDAPIVDFKEGAKGTKNEGRLGAFIVDLEGTLVNVGGGFTDKQRTEFWEKRSELLGKTIEFLGQERTKNKQGTSSVRFGKFKKIRKDK